MDLAYRSVTLKDFDAFYEACYWRNRQNTLLRATLQREWAVLLQNTATLSMIVEDRERSPDEQLVGCVQGVFVTETFARMARAGLPPWINAQATHVLADGSWPLLSYQGVREANSTAGLVGLITRWMLGRGNLKPDDPGYEVCVRNYLLQSFAVFWRGYKFKEILLEVIGEPALQEALHAGFRLLNNYADYYTGDIAPAPPGSHPYLVGITREESLTAQGWLANWAFAHQPPRYFFQFTRREQELLRWALTGADDKEIARLLGCAEKTMPVYWRNIFRKVEDRAPEVLPTSTKPMAKGESRRRGAEKRRVLLRYLDQHPEELCPLHPPRQK